MTQDYIVYFKIDKDDLLSPNDIVKKCSLSAAEIDGNFYHLEGSDVSEAHWNAIDKTLVINFLNSNKEPLVVSGITDSYESVQLAVDSSLIGNGSIQNPLGINFLDKTGQYEPVQNILDFTINGTLYPINPQEGDRFLSKEVLSSNGLLYSQEDIKFISNSLKGTKWEVMPKEHWDNILNMDETCDECKNHSAKTQTELGCFAGIYNKNKSNWINDDDYVIELLPEVPSLNISPVGVLNSSFNLIDANDNASFWTSTKDANGNNFVKSFKTNVDGVVQSLDRNGKYLIRLIRPVNNDFSSKEIILGKEYNCLHIGNYSVIQENLSFLTNGSQVPASSHEEEKIEYFVNEFHNGQWHHRLFKLGESVVVLNDMTEHRYYEDGLHDITYNSGDYYTKTEIDNMLHDAIVGTYQEIKILMDNSALLMNQKYIISDFQTVYLSNDNTILGDNMHVGSDGLVHESSNYRLLLTAISDKLFDSRIKILPDQGHIDSWKWDVWYDIKFLSNLGENHKGTICRIRTQKNIDIPFDFWNILWWRTSAECDSYGITIPEGQTGAYYYTFNESINDKMYGVISPMNDKFIFDIKFEGGSLNTSVDAINNTITPQGGVASDNTNGNQFVNCGNIVFIGKNQITKATWNSVYIGSRSWGITFVSNSPNITNYPIYLSSFSRDISIISDNSSISNISFKNGVQNVFIHANNIVKSIYLNGSAKVNLVSTSGDVREIYIENSAYVSINALKSILDINISRPSITYTPGVYGNALSIKSDNGTIYSIKIPQFSENNYISAVNDIYNVSVNILQLVDIKSLNKIYSINGNILYNVKGIFDFSFSNVSFNGIFNTVIETNGTSRVSECSFLNSIQNLLINNALVACDFKCSVGGKGSASFPLNFEFPIKNATFFAGLYGEKYNITDSKILSIVNDFLVHKDFYPLNDDNKTLIIEYISPTTLAKQYVQVAPEVSVMSLSFDDGEEDNNIFMDDFIY